MRKLIVIVAVLVALGAPAWAAQDGMQERSQQARQQFQQIEERLQLTPKQAEAVRPVLTDEAQQLKTLRDEYADSGQSRRELRKLAREARSIQGKTDDQLKKILSKSQMDEMKKIREERRQELRQRSGRK